MAEAKKRIGILSYREPGDAGENSYFTLLRRGLEAGATSSGLEVGGFWFPSPGFEPKVLASLAGLAVLGSFVPEPVLQAFPRPELVFVNHSQPPHHRDSVHIAFDLAVEDVLDHLTGLGHRKIAVMGGVEYLESLSGSPVRHYKGEPRREAFIRSAKKRGIWSPSWAVDGDWSLRGGYEAMKALLHLPDRPTAVFAANDPMALGALRAIREAGLSVPQDFSLVGFDDLPGVASESPPLTTVRVAVAQIGRTAATMLAERFEGRTAALHTQVAGELVVRGSTAAPRS